MFKQSTEAPKVTLPKSPILYITPVAMKKMEIFVASVSTEIGWMGSCKKVSDHEYLLSDVYVPEQEVNGATTELTSEGLSKLAGEIGYDEVEHLTVWGHSHVNMGVFASGQDALQTKKLLESGIPFLFRIIANKKGDFSLCFYDVATGIEITNVSWAVHYPVTLDETEIAATIKERVKELKWVGNFNFNFQRSQFEGQGVTQEEIDEEMEILTEAMARQRFGGMGRRGGRGR